MIEDRGHYSRSLVAERPDLLVCHQQHPKRYPFLLDSVSSGVHARYSILMAYPERTIQLLDLAEGDFLDALDVEWHANHLIVDDAEDELPFRGGWFLFLAYELLGQIEPSVKPLTMTQNLPLAQMTRIPAAVIIDHVEQRCWIVAESGRESLIAEIARDLDACFGSKRVAANVSIPFVEDPDLPFVEAVHRTLDYCREGDLFQANLSRQWQAKIPSGCSYTDVYHQLCEHNPAPFSGLAVLDEATICSSSPERLVRIAQDTIEMRPIAGTRPRGEPGIADRGFSRELLAHPKERAEHLMLLDLIRNDLGRVSDYGSVHVDEHMVLESYATVHHIVSNVVGQKRSAVTPGEVIRAVFPGGTITGCPKVRCMQIIAELEQAARGAYTGSMGYLNRDGDMDLNILIRTIVMDGEQIRFRAGAGVVADSGPRAELEETRHKARGLLDSLQVEE